MPRRPDKSSFVAPVVRALEDDRFEQKLMGFVVASQIERSGKSRRWWAQRLDVSPSTMTNMTDEPTPGFVEAFDQALAEISPEQRLAPRLTDLYSEVRIVGTAPLVSDWLAGDPATSPEGRPASLRLVLDQLLRSDVAFKRCLKRLKS